MNKKQNLNRKEKDQRIRELEMENQLLRQRLSFIVTIAKASDWTPFIQINEVIKDLNNKTVQKSVNQKIIDDFTFKKEDSDRTDNSNDKNN